MTETADALAPLLTGFSALVGLVIGSFLNVVIHRVPAGVSVITPRSTCPSCGHLIRAWDNVPVLSWLVLRGACRDCRAPISVRYPLVEATTAALFALLAWRFGPAGILPLLLYLAAVGVALFLIDLDHQRLPFALVLPSYPVVAAGLVLAGMLDTDGDWARTVLSTLLWAAAFGVPWLLTGGRGMGLGDVVLAPLLGATLGWLGWGASLVGLMAGFALGAAVGLALIALTDAGRKTKIPYGPFMLAGALVGIFAGPWVFDGYLHLAGVA